MAEIRACQSLSESREREKVGAAIRDLCELKDKPYGPVWGDRTWVHIALKLNTLCILDPPALASEVLDSQ